MDRTEHGLNRRELFWGTGGHCLVLCGQSLIIWFGPQHKKQPPSFMSRCLSVGVSFGVGTQDNNAPGPIFINALMLATV